MELGLSPLLVLDSAKVIIPSSDSESIIEIREVQSSNDEKIKKNNKAKLKKKKQKGTRIWRAGPPNCLVSAEDINSLEL